MENTNKNVKRMFVGILLFALTSVFSGYGRTVEFRSLGSAYAEEETDKSWCVGLMKIDNHFVAVAVGYDPEDQDVFVANGPERTFDDENQNHVQLFFKNLKYIDSLKRMPYKPLPRGLYSWYQEDSYPGLRPGITDIADNTTEADFKISRFPGGPEYTRQEDGSYVDAENQPFVPLPEPEDGTPLHPWLTPESPTGPPTTETVEPTEGKRAALAPDQPITLSTAKHTLKIDFLENDDVYAWLSVDKKPHKLHTYILIPKEIAEGKFGSDIQPDTTFQLDRTKPEDADFFEQIRYVYRLEDDVIKDEQQDIYQFKNDVTEEIYFGTYPWHEPDVRYEYLPESKIFVNVETKEEDPKISSSRHHPWEKFQIPEEEKEVEERPSEDIEATIEQPKPQGPVVETKIKIEKPKDLPKVEEMAEKPRPEITIEQPKPQEPVAEPKALKPEEKLKKAIEKEKVSWFRGIMQRVWSYFYSPKEPEPTEAKPAVAEEQPTVEPQALEEEESPDDEDEFDKLLREMDTTKPRKKPVTDDEDDIEKQLKKLKKQKEEIGKKFDAAKSMSKEKADIAKELHETVQKILKLQRQKLASP